MSILTTQEAVDLLKYGSAENMPGDINSVYLPAVDSFLKDATGKDWGTLTETYTEIEPVAKLTAGVLLIRWFRNPDLIGKADDSGVLSLITQLSAKVLQEQQAVETA